MGQYDLERAATWAMIGSHKHQDDTKHNNIEVTDDNAHTNSEIDYKKVKLPLIFLLYLQFYSVMGGISGRKCETKTGAEHVQV